MSSMGDLVLLSPGDRVAADLELVDAHAMTIDESMLTGESVPVEVPTGARAWAGTFVVDGRGRRRRRRHRGGDPARRHRDRSRAGVRRPRSPLAGELHRVVRTIALVALGVGVAFFGLSLALGHGGT